jgi:Tfp pilus assembly protein PilV
MLLQQIKGFIGIGKNYQGLTLIEALLATALLGIGFSGVYTMTAVASKSADLTIARQEMQLQANQILDLIESDLSNIDQYIMTLETCVAPDQGDTEKYQLRKYEWCSRLAGEVGVATASDTRSINVTTLADGRKVVHIILEAKSGNVQIVMKRVFDDV